MDRIFFGLTKLLSLSLGRDPSSAYLPALDRLTPHIRGPCGLLFTPRPPASVVEFFDSYTPADFARPATPAARTVVLPPGVVYSRAGEVDPEDDVPVAPGMEPWFRSMGVPTRLEKGKVVLDEEYVVCREGEVLDVKSAAVLKRLGVAMAEFRVRVRAYWKAGEEGEVVVVDDARGEEGEMDVEEEVAEEEPLGVEVGE